MNNEWPFEQLEVWEEAQNLAGRVYRCTDDFPEREKYGLVKQIRRAATSVALNIAEGKGRKSDKEYVQFLYNARGSLYEVIASLKIASRLELVPSPELQDVEEKAYEIYKMLSGLINAIEEETDQ